MGLPNSCWGDNDRVWWNFILIFLVINSFLFYLPFLMLRLETVGDRNLRTKKGGYDLVFFWKVSVCVGFFGYLMGFLALILFNNTFLQNYGMYLLVICGLIA